MDNIPHNARIQLAIADLESQNRINYTTTAKKWDLDRTTLARRHRGETGTREKATSNSYKTLTDLQEKALVERINILSTRGMPPTPQIVKNLAEELANRKLNKNWVANFTERYDKELISIYLRVIDHKRKIADNSHHFIYFFKNIRYFLIIFRLLFAYHAFITEYYIQLFERVERFHILPSNIYNFDEKGFLVGVSRKKKRIVTAVLLFTKQLFGFSYDGSREFIILIISICADGSYIFLILIYKNEASHILDI